MMTSVLVITRAAEGRGTGTTTFENAQVGDRVYSLIEGYGLLSRQCTKAVKASLCRYVRWYKLDGYYADGDGGMQILYWDVPEIIYARNRQSKLRRLIRWLK